MDLESRNQFISYIDAALIFVWGIFFLAFPFVFSTLTTESVILPKQIFLSAVVLVSLLFLAVKMVIAQQVKFRATPLDVPIALFAFALLLSSLLSINRFDSLIAFVPLLLAILGYYVVVNILRRENAVSFAIYALVASASAIAALAVFSFLKVYPLPFAYTHTPSFTPLGSLLEQAVFLVALFPLCVQLGLPLFKGDTSSKTIAHMAAACIIGAGILVTLAQLVTTQKPLILPFETGFQTAFAAISQDTGRIAQGFFFGNGFGNYASAFTRFKQASFNANPALWFVPFTQSSSLVLELLATTGIVGMLSFFLILFRSLTKPSQKKTNPMYFSIAILALAAFFLPFSFEGITFLFLFLAIFTSIEAFKHPHSFFDIEPRVVALKKGLIALHQTQEQSTTNQRYEYSAALPYTTAILLLVFVGVVGFYAGKYVISNIDFQKSILAANNNNGSITYTLQVQALNTFPYQSSYYRIFSQTNIALANSIAASQPKASSPSAQAQQTIYGLIQQGITTARTATILSPQTVGNWQNLASVYRSLIGLGQNADNFTIASMQQAITLDSNNPQEYLTLGGLYYQLGQYDNAIRQFQQSITLKQDYPNAYYNLAHAYEQKQDTADALSNLQIVKQLVANDKANYDKVSLEIDELQKSAPSSGANSASPGPVPATTNKAAPEQTQPLNVNGQQSSLPSQPTQIPLQATPTPTPTK